MKQNTIEVLQNSGNKRDANIISVIWVINSLEKISVLKHLII